MFLLNEEIANSLKADKAMFEYAQKIVQDYGKSLATSSSNCIARKKSSLCNTIPEIKQAFFIYIRHIIEQGLFDYDKENAFSLSYGALSQFIDDNDANEINSTDRSKPNDKRSKYMKESFENMTKLLDEIGNFIREIKKECGQNIA